jgi:hypothetical protein
MKRISSLVILVVILALLNGLAFADFDSTSANITNQYFSLKKRDWRNYVYFGEYAGETTTLIAVGTEVAESVNCLKLFLKNDPSIDNDPTIDIDAILWIAQDTDGNIWFVKVEIFSSGGKTTYTIGSGISNPLVHAVPKVGDRITSIFPESVGTYGEVTQIGINVGLSTGLGPYSNCAESTEYYDFEVETLTYSCPEVGMVKTIYTQESPGTRQELSEFGNYEFVDVSSNHWAEEAIYKIFYAGITRGCSQNPLMYCPDGTVTRTQMAVFLGRAVHGSNFTPPSATGIFSDVPVSYWAAGWIEQFYNDGITSGCGTNPLRYCPGNNVTRAQMAIFLLRSKLGKNYTPPSANGIFSDVPVTYWAADWIEQLYNEGITTGCGTNPLQYCPNNSVTRAQMAVFIMRTFGL